MFYYTVILKEVIRYKNYSNLLFFIKVINKINTNVYTVIYYYPFWFPLKLLINIKDLMPYIP